MVFYFKSVAGPFFPVNLYQTSLFPLHGHQRSSQRATESGVELLEPGIYSFFLISMDWFKGKSTGNHKKPSIFHGKIMGLKPIIFPTSPLLFW
jgi:hypothetical protein